MQQSSSQEGDASEVVRRWLEETIKASGMQPTPFAKKARLSPSTILRNLEGMGALDLGSIEKIILHHNAPPPPIFSDAPAPPVGITEAEVVSYCADVPTWWRLELKPKQGLWQVNTRACELAGILPGDVILVDCDVAPRAPREGEPRDVVVAEVRAAGAVETVIRIYDPPYLLTETADPAARRKPLLVDNDRVSIWGVQVKLFRERKD